MVELSNLEKRVLLALAEIGDTAEPEDIQEKADLPQLVHVMNASSWLQSKGLVRHEETVREFIRLAKDGKKFQQNGLPERRALDALLAAGGKATTGALLEGGLQKDELSIALGWLRRKGLATIGKEDGDTVLTATDAGRAAEGTRLPDEAVLDALADVEGEVAADTLDAEGLKALKGRQNLIHARDEVTRLIHVTSKGRRVIDEGIELREEVSQLTPELVTGGWKDVDIRPYDVTAFAPLAHGGKTHPLRQIIDRIRRVFLDMGFTEIEGPFVRSAFWNMDVLYTPQDHPAREMQDTFYLARPERAELDSAIVDRVKAIHEHGGDTGSTGWRTDWSEDVASQLLLRTHTTVDTINYLANHPEPPVKVFSVDRVFRNEAVDATHLPEFHQVEGIVMEDGANLRMLIGLLREFYRKMGAEDVRVRPAYFPYTEPSLEVEVFYNGRWMELGGAGIFRKEVTDAVGVKHPVLAWGLGLERLAMMILGLTDVRDLYVSDVEWLRNAPLVD